MGLSNSSQKRAAWNRAEGIREGVAPSQVHRVAVVPYSAEQMFGLVADVEAYPLFVPYCRGARVEARFADGVQARIEFAKGGLSKSFTTRNTNHGPHWIEMRLVDGPFRDLQGIWRFVEVQQGAQATRVSLDLRFEFSNRLVASLVGPVFSQFANKMVDAFSDRARTLYG